MFDPIDPFAATSRSPHSEPYRQLKFNSTSLPAQSPDLSHFGSAGGMQLPPINTLLSPKEPATVPPFSSPSQTTSPARQADEPPAKRMRTYHEAAAFTPSGLFAHRKEMGQAALPSPPDSGNLGQTLHSFGSTQDENSPDPPLYSPETPATHVADSEPLFATQKEDAVDAAITGHIADTSEAFEEAGVERPERRDYKAVCQVFNAIKRVGVEHFRKQELEYLAWYGRPVGHARPRKVLQDGSAHRRAQRALMPKPARDVARQHRGDVPPRTPRAPRAKTRTPRTIELDAVGSPIYRAKPVKVVQVYNFEELPDYAPPVETMKNPEYHADKVRWNGATHAGSLDDDPDRTLLSRHELVVASKLRLSCAKYLTQKRRIFMKLIDVLREGKEFKKTNCQDCRMIDVNKLSTLWVFYHGVGWFDRKHYTNLL